MPAIAQPIETAPRDGTRIIGLAAGGWREMWFKRDPYEGDYWTDEMDGELVPTHWVGLPMMQFEMPNEVEEIRKVLQIPEQFSIGEWYICQTTAWATTELANASISEDEDRWNKAKAVAAALRAMWPTTTDKWKTYMDNTLTK